MSKVLALTISFSQQFYCILILLHRPFAQFHSTESNNHSNHTIDDYPPYPEANQLAFLSRKVCLSNAIRVAKIFKYHHIRFQGSQMFITGLDHAGTAATALIAGIANIVDRNERTALLRYLRWIADALKGMSSAYRAAERMTSVLESIFEDPDWSQVPVARELDAPKELTGDRSMPAASRERPKRPWSPTQTENVPGLVPRSGEGAMSNNYGSDEMSSHPSKYLRSASGNPAAGFGIDAILAGGENDSAAGSFRRWFNESDGLNILDPLFLEQDFTNLAGYDMDAPGLAAGLVGIERMDESLSQFASHAAQISHNSIINSMSKDPLTATSPHARDVVGRSPTQLVDGGIGMGWPGQPQNSLFSSFDEQMPRSRFKTPTQETWNLFNKF